MQQKGKLYKNTTIRIDPGEFVDCVFDHCVLEFGGHFPAKLSGCTFNECQWMFVAEAANTLQFFSAFYSGVAGGKEIIEKTFQNIRSGALAKGAKPRN